MKQLNLPPYEWLKALPLKDAKGKPCQYEFTLFDTPVAVCGRLSYNEDDSRFIFFDVMEGFHTGMNDYGLSLKFNEKNYQKLCKHAQKIYELFLAEPNEDMSWQWEWECTPDEYFKEEIE